MNLYVGLVHYPVKGKQGEVITSSVTNIDLHDIARTCTTFGIKKYFIITPLPEQKRIVQRIIDHWCQENNKNYHPDRSKAFEIIHVIDSIEQAQIFINNEEHREVKVITTAAKKNLEDIGIPRFNEILDKNPVLLLFGTSWGLDQKVIDQGFAKLNPIEGTEAYNHLSVRSAVAIYLYDIRKKESSL
jgi:tRNA (guanine37-N1)-methyltransferase